MSSFVNPKWPLTISPDFSSSEDQQDDRKDACLYVEASVLIIDPVTDEHFAAMQNFDALNARIVRDRCTGARLPSDARDGDARDGHVDCEIHRPSA